jgi:hypothetical protein
MKFVLSAFLLALFAVAVASAQETEPVPTAKAPPANATPQEQNGPTQTASPTPGVSPAPESQESPQLLPESNTLPMPPASGAALPRDLIPQGTKPQIPGSVPNAASAEQLEKDKVRFRQLRTIAVRDPYAIYFFRRARMEHTDEMKREYMRVYYITMCDEMRELEPRLKPMIDVFENASVGRLSQVSMRPTIPQRDLPRFNGRE